MEAILFDWDGTLVDSLGAFHAANSTVMAAFGLSFDVVVYRRNYVPDWREMYRRLGIPGDRIDEANDLWETAFAADGDTVRAFPGAADALLRLRDAGASLGIVTAGHRDVVDDQLERYGLGELIRTRVFGSDDIAAKPHPDPLLRVLDELGRSDRIATARYVGDVPDDMRMAKAVGTLGIGIESTIGSRDVLLAAGATEVYPSVAAFVAALLDAPLDPTGGRD